MSDVKCYNRDTKGRCSAFVGIACTSDCPGRIKTINEKIKRLKAIRGYYNCAAPAQLNKEIAMAERVKQLEKEHKYEDWMSCYYEDTHRGGGGGSSEQDSNNATSLKQKMKDNRPQSCKLTSGEKAKIKEETAKWEEENGKLERLGRTGMSHSHLDSYTEEPICYIGNPKNNKCDNVGKNSKAHCKDCIYV